MYNREVSLFNGYHIQEDQNRASGVDDKMVMEAAEARYANDPKTTQAFRRHHWWEAVRKEAKWRAQFGPGSGVRSKKSRLGVSGEYSSSEATEEEEEPRSMGRDRAKAASRRKGKESSSSNEGASKSIEMKGIYEGLVKAKLYKEWNKMKDRAATRDMDAREKRIHEKAIKKIENDLGLNDDEEEEEE